MVGRGNKAESCFFLSVCLSSFFFFFFFFFFSGGPLVWRQNELVFLWFSLYLPSLYGPSVRDRPGAPGPRRKRKTQTFVLLTRRFWRRETPAIPFKETPASACFKMFLAMQACQFGSPCFPHSILRISDVDCGLLCQRNHLNSQVAQSSSRPISVSPFCQGTDEFAVPETFKYWKFSGKVRTSASALC